MATRIKKLTARTVENLGEGFHSDGGGLYLRVRDSGSRAWVFRYTKVGKTREVGLGATHVRTLASARELAEKMRSEVANGHDPAALMRVDDSTTRLMTFEACAAALIDTKRAGWRNAKHAQQWENTLRDYVYPTLGKKHPKDIGLTEVKAVLLPLWTTKTETATRVRQRIEAVLDWASVHELRSGENPARWKGVLDKILPAPNKLKNVQHFAAAPYPEVPGIMAALALNNYTSAQCLQFLILTATRSSEARGARWTEIDLDSGIWTIPGERMKAGKPHRVPLASEVVTLLHNVYRFENQPLVFPGGRGKLLSDVALNKALHNVHLGITVHGFRASFRQWCAEQTNTPSAVCEAALAHVNDNKVEAAYQRSDLFERRRELMQTWANYLQTEHIDNPD